MDKKLWFKAKRFGWGWYPVTWQGWGILVMYIFSLFSLGIFSDKQTMSDFDFLVHFFPTVFILTVFLIIICYAHGEKPKWNWGITGRQMEEFDVLDAQGNKTGNTKTRKEVHEKGLWHMSVHMYIVNPKKQILLQLRNSNMETFPSMWYLSAGGHVSKGQTNLEAAIRETKEEIGIELDKKVINYIGTIRKQNVFRDGKYIDNEYNSIFVAEMDFDVKDVKIQKSEVSVVKWFEIEAFKNAIEQKDPNFVNYAGIPLLLKYLDGTTEKY